MIPVREDVEIGLYQQELEEARDSTIPPLCVRMSTASLELRGLISQEQRLYILRVLENRNEQAE